MSSGPQRCSSPPCFPSTLRLPLTSALSASWVARSRSEATSQFTALALNKPSSSSSSSSSCPSPFSNPSFHMVCRLQGREGSEEKKGEGGREGERHRQREKARKERDEKGKRSRRSHHKCVVNAKMSSSRGVGTPQPSTSISLHLPLPPRPSSLGFRNLPPPPHRFLRSALSLTVKGGQE